MEEKKKEELKDEKDIKKDGKKSVTTDNQQTPKNNKKEKDMSTNAEKTNESKSTFKVVKPSENDAKNEKETKENKKSDGKSKETKTKKKGNGGKVFLVILLIIILAMVIHYVKNQLIFAKIYNTAKNYTSIENYEVKREITGTDMTNTTDAKYLNGFYKVTFTQSDNTKLTIVTMQNKVAMLTEKNGVKTIKFLNKDKVTLNGIIGLENHTFTSNEWYNNCCSMIHTKTEDGKEYYVVSGFNSNLLPMTGDHAEAYINKETGLIEKIVETGKDGKVVCTTTYQYEFNNVKTTDLGIPDISSYKLAE